MRKVTSGKRIQNAVELIDSLFSQIPSEADTLLDMRLALTEKAEAGICVHCYFRLKNSLSDWYLKDLEKIREALETSIKLEIVLEEKNQRSFLCLGLGKAKTINDYCDEKIVKIAASNKLIKRIRLGFCWDPYSSPEENLFQSSRK